MASTSSDCSDTFESNEAGSSKDLLNLPDDLPTLKKIIQQKDNNLNLAGQFGKQLLESNTELSQELENVRNQARSKMEKVEQEIYELQSKVQRNKMMEESYQDEIESLKSQIDRVREETEVMCDTRQQRAERDLKKHIATLEDDIETCRLAERQAKERSVQLQDTLDDVRTQLDDRLQTLNQTCSEEMAALNLENNTLRNDNASLSEELHNANAQLEKLHLQISKSVRNFESQDEQIEQLQCQNTSYFNALEKSRLQVQELNLQLDTLMMEKQQHNKKGNSLFSEVEDRRVAAEKELCMLKGKVQLLEEQYGESKKHILTLKFQIAGLLQISSGRVEEEHVMWLQNELSRAQYEIKKLSQKLQDSDSSQSNKAVLEKVFHHGWEDYADYVNNLLGEKDAEIKKIKDELSTKRMYLSAETMRVHEIESNLYRTKKQLNEVSAKCEKRRLTIEELRLKYEPDKVTHKTEKRHIVVEQIPMPASSVENKENIHGANSNLSTVDQLLTTASAEDNMFIDDNLRTLIKANQERAAARKKESRPTKKTVTLSDNVDVIPEAELCDDVSNLTDQSMDQIASAAGKRAPKGKRCYDGKDTLIVDENAENVAQCKQS